MLSTEKVPSSEYMDAFRDAFAAKSCSRLNRGRAGRDIARLAKALATGKRDEIVLVSLARADTPIGVLLRRTLGILRR
ncbi:MAG: hypothetical protein FD153_2058, partial [Rhodospirillaceae bacterium]